MPIYNQKQTLRKMLKKGLLLAYQDNIIKIDIENLFI